MPTPTVKQLAQVPHFRSLAGMAGAPLDGTTLITPDQISGLQLWLRADSLGLAQGAGVATWLDASGAGRNATQPTGANQPLYQAAAAGGLPTVRFAGDTGGTSQYLTTTDGNSYAAATIVLVASKPTANFADACAVIGTRAAPNATKCSASNETIGWTGKLNTNTVIGMSAPATLFAIDGVSYPVGAIGVSINNGGQNIGAATTFHIYTYQQASSVGAKYWCVGADAFSAVGNRHWAGDVAEIIVYSGALSTANRYAVEAYLAAKYSLPVVQQ